MEKESHLNSKVKIVHVVTTFYPGPGGLGRTFLLAKDQQRRGWQVEFIIGRNASPELIRQKEQEGFPVIQLVNLRKYVHPTHDMKAIVDLALLFRKKKYDLVHTHWAKAGILGRIAAYSTGIKRIVHSVYGPTFPPTISWKNRFLYLILEKLAGKFTSQFIFVGKELQTTYLQAGICTPANSCVIYGGRDLSDYVQAAVLPEKERQARKRKLGFDPRSIVIGYVARLVPSKGHIMALHAFRQLNPRKHHLKLIFVGAAKVPSEEGFIELVKHEVARLTLERDVLLIGWQAEPAYYYGLFDIFLFPSHYEGLPGAVLEARAAGLKVVGFDCGGVREILGNNGNIVAVGDLSGLVRALEKEIARLPETRCLRGVNLEEIQRLQDKFSIARMLEETGRLYKNLLFA